MAPPSGWRRHPGSHLHGATPLLSSSALRPAHPASAATDRTAATMGKKAKTEAAPAAVEEPAAAAPAAAKKEKKSKKEKGASASAPPAATPARTAAAAPAAAPRSLCRRAPHCALAQRARGAARRRPRAHRRLARLAGRIRAQPPPAAPPACSLPL